MNRIQTPPLTEALSDRERAVAERFAAGLTYREIGEALFIAPSTVRTHLATIYGKLGVRNKIELASWVAQTAAGRIAPETAAPSRVNEPASPALAVFPIECLNPEERWHRFADGLSSDICVDLARFADLPVIAFHTMKLLGNRPESFSDHVQAVGATYAVTGQLRADDRRVRLTIQLSDTRTGMTLWSERYEREMEDVLTLQDSLTESVINVLAGCFGTLAAIGRKASRLKPPGSLQAYDCFLLGVEQHNRFSPDGNAAAKQLLTRSLELDPGRARAWTELAYVYSIQAANGFGDDLNEAFRNWRRAVDEALRLDPTDPAGQTCLGDLRACLGDLAGAAEAHARAFEFGKNNADTLALLAGAKALIVGDPADGIPLIERALSLNPLGPPWYYGMLARVLFVVGRYRECLSALERSSQESPNTLMFQAMAHACLGETKEAAEVASRLKTEFPSFTVEGFIAGYPISNPSALEVVRQGARLAMLD
ncbi:MULTISPECIES: LuxR C-terminal-related transcriptional regulator [unclassified Ensifer]|uniref:LuxR C-terminal-related transcriptional regulator n=1 Tax=unclassified Ensifer TaxID=2633371 RepID=UPI00081314C1|nr:MULTISPECIES: LuxR C-terminal-related transcriptional regulator [unclassified Ensifer]OCP02553.1 adenylate cyclase [Ensifer sp. LC14]OCP09314.1 adenylate cyclase [Ensifer sp. LC13]OCP10495.1 adenylate cyclase [Ensifer sp. LC11]OCP32562.1 adenylate cyclase [Ensifer sp. LC499]